MIRAFLFMSIYVSVSMSQRVVGYYPQWVQNGFPASNIDLSVVTHVNHAFAWPDENGNIQSYDNMFNTSINQTIHDGGRKILLSLGGWGNDAGFAIVAASPELRTTFIDNLIDICDTYGYDGVDIDWEHPWSHVDRQNLNFLMVELDSIFNAYNPDLLITMAVPISNWAGQWYDFSILRFCVDYFNAMTYDIHGSWSEHAGHNSPLYQSPPGDPDGSCITGINYLANARGIPESQLNLGLPFWGKKYIASGINEPFTGDVIDKRYYEIPNLIGNGWTYEWDSDAFCPYLIKDDQSKVLTFDDQESIRYKCEYTIERGLGGVMIWALGYDVTENGQELIQSIEENYLSTNLNDEVILSRQLSLKAYPNPFNSNCVFEFELLMDEFIKLNLFSITGQHIETLENEKRRMGKHTIIWDGGKMAQSFSSGIFIIELSGQKTKSVQKIIYLK